VEDPDPNHHGTFVATLAAAPADGAAQSFIGVAPFAPVVFVRVSSSELDLRGVPCGLAYLHQVAKDEPVVANMSFNDPSIPASRYAQLIRDQALIVAATPNNQKPTYAGQPAGYAHTLAVGDSEHRFHPQRTTQLDVLAPGIFDDLPLADVGYGGATTSFGGTSFATALVSGAAALVWAKTGTDNPQVVAYLLRRTARFGTGWTRQHGFGTINVASAVSFRAPADDEFEPNDTFRSAWPSPTTPVLCRRRCTLHGIAGKTDDPRDWWPVRVRSCAAIAAVRVTPAAARYVGCRPYRRGKVSVGVAAGKKGAGITRFNANVAYTVRITAR
jgi:subtilisin family serine protease